MTTPPPHGQNPFAQGQQPYGQPQGQAPYPPQGPAPYPPQGGYPQQPGQPGFPPPGAVPYAAVPPQPSRKVKTIRNIVIVAVVACFAIGGYIASRNDAETATVGDCMHRGSSDDSHPDLEVVDCSSSKAQYVVLAKVKGSYTTEIAASTKCETEAKDFKYTYTQSDNSSDFLLCLKDYTK